MARSRVTPVVVSSMLPTTWPMRRLRSQAGRQAQAGQRLLAGEALADAGQPRHVAVGPEDALLAQGGQVGVLDVATRSGGRSHVASVRRGETVAARRDLPYRSKSPRLCF